MPYGHSAFQRPLMRGRVVDEPESPVVLAKRALTVYAAEEYELSWRIGRFSEPDRWALKWYHTELKPELPGALVIVDNDSSIDVQTYSAGDWHGRTLEYRYMSMWYQFVPQIALAEWKSGAARWADCPDMPAEVNW
jgi:hypothetical protein